MLLLHRVYLRTKLLHLSASFFNSGISFRIFSLPSFDVSLHFVVPPPFLVNVLAELTYFVQAYRIKHQLQAACFSNAVFFVALLPEMTPSPVAAVPFRLVKVAHDLHTADSGRIVAEEK